MSPDTRSPIPMTAEELYANRRRTDEALDWFERDLAPVHVPVIPRWAVICGAVLAVVCLVVAWRVRV